jgi:uncharacterized membrane protein
MHAAWIRLRSHIVTGFIFIMPVLITLAVLMKFWSHLLKGGSRLAKLLHVNTVFGPPGDAVMAVLFFLFICIVAGFLIRFSFLKTMSERIDRQLNALIPGYGQLRSEARNKIGGEEEKKKPSFDACLVKVQDLWQPGYLIERNGDGTWTVFVPEVPGLTAGHVYVADSARIRKLEIASAVLDGYLKILGKGLPSRPLQPL